ncbi:uncharacterized protein LOC126839863 [Adelges cooleyi]|uniref:uncharacterized protein LOC126839863 n=1 Tax=Adelges cooleyi TaxID=133065 RepID=UPI00218098F8|nr:uncharacterized protein LOC126839863 [Adelges cooleyi]
MCSINTILFFCVALYFLHCQCGNPTTENVQMIRNIVKKHKRTTSIDFKGVKDVIKEVAEKTGVYKKFYSFDRKFTIDEVERIAHEFVVFQDQDLTEVIRNIVKKYGIPNGINFKDVKNVIKEVAKTTRLSEEFPSLDELQTAAPNREFTMDEVVRIAQEFLALQHPDLKEIIRDIFEKHEKPDGIDIVELKGVIQNVIREMGTPIEFPDVDELKNAISNCKFTAEEVEAIVNDYLFSK